MNPILHKTDLPPVGTRLRDMTPAQREALPPGTRLDQIEYSIGILTKNIDGLWYDERGFAGYLTTSVCERPVLSYPAPAPPSYDALLGARKALNEIGTAVGLPEWSDPDRVARAASARITSLEKDVEAAADRAQVALSKAEAERDAVLSERNQARRDRDTHFARVRELEGVVRKKVAERDQARKDLAEVHSATNHAVLRAVPLGSLLDEVERRARREEP